MANNIEKFGTPKSMKDLELEEGLADYEEGKIETAAEETREKTQKALEKQEQKRLELSGLTAEEKTFLDTIITSIYRNKNKSEVGQGYLNPNIVRSIAEINLKTALRIVRQEKRPRVEVLAELATLAKANPEAGVDFGGLISTIETFANKTHENDYTKKQDFDYYPTSIAKAAVALRESAPDISERLLQLAIDNATADQSRDGWSRGNGFIAKCHMVEEYARVNPQKAEELLKEFKVSKDETDTKPVQATIEKYIELGDTDSAFRVAIEHGDVAHIVLAGEQIARADVQGLIAAIIEKWVTKKEKYSSTSPERAVEVYERLADSLFCSGDEENAQKLLDEAKSIAEQQGDRGIQQLVKVVSHSDPKAAIELIHQNLNDKNDQYAITRNRLINDVVIRTALHNPDKAREIYQTSKPDSLGKQDALVSLILEYKRYGDEEGAESILAELKTNIAESGEYDTKWRISFENIYKISEHYPELALEILKNKKGSLPKLRDQAGQVGARKLFEIFDRNGLSAETQREWITFFGQRYSFDSERAVLDSVLLDKISEKSEDLLSEKGMLSYFQSLDPNNEADIDAFKKLTTIGLLPEHKIEDLLQKNDTQSFHLSSLLLSAELYKKTDFDLASFDRLMALAQSENESVKGAAIHGIKLLQPKIAELFYSSNQQYQDMLKKLFELSPEAQQWFADLDAYIAGNFDTQNLIRLVTRLGSVEANQMFPQAIEKAREEILAHVQSNEDLADYYLENLHLYKDQPWAAQGLEGAIKHYPVAQKFIKAVDSGSAQWKDSPYVAAVYAKAKLTKPHDEWDDEDEYYGGAESEGFLEEDPFKKHPLREIRSSLGLGRIMAEKITPAEAGFELSSEAINALREINNILTNEHKNFLESFQNNPAVPEEDRIALTDQSQSKVKMNNLLPNVRNFVGRYLAQIANGDPEKLSEVIVSQKDAIESMVQEGYRRYLKIYEVDIPLYDKLYEEFDHWRESGRYPMEVYLGRDGIYAYIGRRAQDATRRSKVGRKKREQLRSEGEVIEINPKYLVYPRYFRDNINYDTKRAFLEQEQISPDMDPLFYDTGYTGTIPEQIMRVMDFDQADIEERIRLLSAPSAKRRVKGIPENARSEIIEYIEHNAKTENTAEGLLQDEKTGKIRHVASPTDPEEQFYFMMIKQAISRHYMVQERLHFKVPENANYDSENYYIRVRQEYADILPADFISNPKKYFEQQGTLLKGSKGEGEYPDEEVLSFKLEDGTEVIAKRVELRKSKEARKEFMILIASKKAGLPTAEPVGFLSGKKEEDGSYLLMEKLEGYSGRKFEKYLQESGKFTDEQITEIMKTVAEKLKDLAQMFRDQLNIDKRWRIKDTIIQFNEETGEVEDVIPIDWERVKTYDPNKPQKIDLVE
jgi:hypothetical protein